MARLLVVALLCACIPAPPRATCVLDDDCAAGTACFEGSCAPGFHQDGGLAWCPKPEARLKALDQQLFKVSCGAKTSSCHDAQAASDTSGLDLSGPVFRALVNVPAENVAATASDGGVLLLVKPGDPDNSFLAIKLRLATSKNPYWGGGMPPEHPGAVCEPAQQALAEWIRQGAQDN